MSPEILTAAITGATALLAAALAILGTRSAAKMAADEAHKDTANTLTEQREQLEKTLAEQHFRTLNERFATAAGQLGDDKPAVRLAGVHAMAALADDWKDNRQGCIDVLCAYLRLPYETTLGDDASGVERTMWLGNREVRHTVLRVIAAHLRPTDLPGSQPVSWCGMDFDFTGAVFDGGDLSYVEFSGGRVSFVEAEFFGGTVYFTGAKFTAGRVSFAGARFAGGWLDFQDCRVAGDSSGVVPGPTVRRAVEHRVNVQETDYAGDYLTPGPLSFIGTQFDSGGLTFKGSSFSGGTVDFYNARFGRFYAGFSDVDFNGGNLSFIEAQFTADAVSFDQSRFKDGCIDFTEARFYGENSTASFRGSKFAGATVQFPHVKFAGPFYLDFTDAEFASGIIDFTGARFAGARASFKDAQFAGSSIVLRDTEYYGVVEIYFNNSDFSSGCLDFTNSKFFSGKVDFSRARFGGSTVDFSAVSEWRKPPIFPDYDRALPGLILPAIGTERTR